MAKRVIVREGDIFCVEIDGRYKYYFQYVIRNDFYLGGQVIRVFRTRYAIDADPKMDDIVKDDVVFYAHTLIRIGLMYNAWYKVGKSSDRGVEQAERVIYGAPMISDHTFKEDLNNWYIYRINKIHEKVGVLPAEYYNIELAGVMHFVDIVNRIKYGYYRYTNPAYEVLKRVPWPDADSYLRVEEEGKTVYYHFKGKKAVEELIVTDRGLGIRLTAEHPENNGYALRKADFGDTNWRFDNFITAEEFHAAWDRL